MTSTDTPDAAGPTVERPGARPVAGGGRGPSGARAGDDLPGVAAPNRSVDRRVGIIWGLLLFNGLAWLKVATVIPIPHRIGQAMTMGSLVPAFVLALSINRRLRVRPYLLLVLYTLLAVVTLTTGLRGTAGHGALLRAFRLSSFIGILWLLTPWFARRDLLLLRCHLRGLLVVLGSVIVGLVLAPGKAIRGDGGRLQGVIWPIPPPQVAHYAAIVAGCSLVLWLAGVMERGRAFTFVVLGVVMILATHTRTAALAVVVAGTLGALSLVLSRARVRRAITVLALAAPLVVVVLAPVLIRWATRNQSSQAIASLTGRKGVWATVFAEPRSEFERLFGFGMSNDSSDGRPIDDTWLAVYQDDGLVGDGLIGTALAVLLITAFLRRSGPARAVGLFLVVYVSVASYTEVTLGDPSPYLLHLVVASGLFAAAVAPRRALWSARTPSAARAAATAPAVPAPRSVS